MKIVQAVPGVFHHFDLARELHERGHLRKVYSTWPWARLQREGLARNLVATFIPFHTPNYLLANHVSFYPRPLYDAIDRLNFVAFDLWLAYKIPPCDAYIALSGVGVRSGPAAQRLGAKFICDRGSTHHRYQTQVLTEEYARWQVATPPTSPWQTELEEATYDEADAIVVPSQNAVDSFVTMGVPASKLHRIPYGVQLHKFTRTTHPPDIRDRFEAIFVGQVGLRKGIPYLLEAWAKVRHPNKRLRIIGGIAQDIKDLLPRLPQGSVEFTGILPQAQLPEVMGGSHVLVLPSVEDGFGLVVPQAMACACPILVSRGAGSCDMVTEEVDGFIVGERDVDALADRMQRLIDEPDLQQRMSAAAVESVNKLGGWQEFGDRWESLLHSLTGK